MAISPTHFCGPKFSGCCFVIGMWGIIMLFALGGLFKINSRALIHDAPEQSEAGMASAANQCFIAGGIYVATTAISFWQLRVNQAAAARKAAIYEADNFSQ